MSSRRATCLVDPAAVAPLRLSVSAAGVSRVSTSQAAYDAGVEAGRAAALAEVAEANEEARRALEGAAAALSQAARQLQEVRAEAVRADVHDAMGLVVELVEALVGTLPQKLGAERLEEALMAAPEDEIPVVRLHPDDAKVALSVAVDAKVVEDPSVERGGCVVEVGPTRIDAQVGPALERLRSMLGAAPAARSAH